MTNIIPVSGDFGQRLKEFMDRFGAKHTPMKVSYEMGTKYVKVISGPYGKQAIHAFIDFSGNIYRPATERMPKKTALGSIYDDDFGLRTAVDPIGLLYIR
jgi:hypothetical protein